MKMTRITPFIVGAFAIVGCHDATPGPTAPDAPLFNFTNGPDNPGKSIVIRFQSHDVFGASDGAGVLIAFHLASDAVGPFGCGPADLPVFDTQFINTAAGIARSITHVNDAPVYIYSFPNFLAALSGDLCGFLADEWLYQGNHRLTLVGDFSAGGTTLGWSAHGNVFDPSGDLFRYTEAQTAVVEKDGTVRFLNEDIRVHRIGRK